MDDFVLSYVKYSYNEYKQEQTNQWTQKEVAYINNHKNQINNKKEVQKHD